MLKASLFHFDEQQEKNRVFKIIWSYIYWEDGNVKPGIVSPV